LTEQLRGAGRAVNNKEVQGGMKKEISPNDWTGEEQIAN